MDDRYHTGVELLAANDSSSAKVGFVSDDTVRWPRVREILSAVMARWERRAGRRGLPGIHDYYWDTPQQLAGDEAMGKRFIEPGVPADETALVMALRRGLGSIPKMPMGGPFLTEDEVQEVVRWIDQGMPEQPG